MIRLTPAPTFEATVLLNVIGQEQPVPAQFVFRSLSRERLASLLIFTGLTKRWWGRRLVEYFRLCWRVKRLATLLDMHHELIESWSGFDVPYSRAALHALFMEVPGAGVSIFVAYLTHQEDARRKN